MKKRVLILIGVGAIIVAAIIYFVIINICQEKNHFIIVTIENSIDKGNIKSLIDQIKELNNNNEGELEVKLILKSGEEINYKHQERQEFNPDYDFYNDCEDSLYKFIKSKRSKGLSNDEANTMLQSLVQVYNNIINSSYKNEYIIIAGNFPNCYDEKAANEAIKYLGNLKTDITNKTIVWFLKSNIQEPEQKILSYINGKTKVIDKQISVEKRKCDSLTSFSKDTISINFLIFSKISDDIKTKIVNILDSIVKPNDYICINLISKNEKSSEFIKGKTNFHNIIRTKLSIDGFADKSACKIIFSNLEEIYNNSQSTTYFFLLDNKDNSSIVIGTYPLKFNKNKKNNCSLFFSLPENKFTKPLKNVINYYFKEFKEIK